MKQFIKFALLILITFSSQAQWISNYGRNNPGDVNLSNAKGLAVTLDNYGSCYVTGYCNEGYTGNDIVLIKYDLDGDTAWVRSYNGTANQDDAGYGICTDADGNIYIVGTSSNTGKSYDITLLKYNTNGDLQWDINYSAFNGFAEDRGLGIAVDESDNIYITGYGTTQDGYNLIVTQKYATDGNIGWNRYDSNSAGDSRGLGITVDNNGNVYVVGYVPAGSSSDMILLGYDSEGNVINRQVTGGEGEDKAWGIAVDNSENVYITGYQTDSAGNSDCYTAKYSSSGSLVWNSFYNGTGNSEDKAFGIAVDENDNIVFITGFTTDDNGNVNYVTIRYSSTGYEQWVATYDGTGNNIDRANAICLIYVEGDLSQVVVTGESWGTNDNFDYATVRYDVQSGDQASVSRYYMTPSTEDMAEDMAASDETGNIYITGYSEIIIDGHSGGSNISTMMLPGVNSELTTNTNVPAVFELKQNYPNPFNPSTNIQFNIPVNARVKLAIYDMLGKTVDVLINQDLNAGSYTINYSNPKLSSGVYFYELSSNSQRIIKKMTLIK